MGQTFVGALLLAVTTSLPELVASLAAIRIGAYDLAVGNLFGSNAFNMTILFAADAAYAPGPILAAIAPAQVVAGVGAILLMAIALAAVVHGTRTRIRRLEPDAIVVLVAYVVLIGAIWKASTWPCRRRERRWSWSARGRSNLEPWRMRWARIPRPVWPRPRRHSGWLAWARTSCWSAVTSHRGGCWSSSSRTR